MEVCLDKRFRARGGVCRIHRRVFLGGPCVAENSQVVVVGEIPTRGQRADPCLPFIRPRKIQEE